jgi:hypothetical protein
MDSRLSPFPDSAPSLHLRSRILGSRDMRPRGHGLKNQVVPRKFPRGESNAHLSSTLHDIPPQLNGAICIDPQGPELLALVLEYTRLKITHLALFESDGHLFETREWIIATQMFKWAESRDEPGRWVDKSLHKPRQTKKKKPIASE